MLAFSIHLACVPGTVTLNLKALARASGDRKFEDNRADIEAGVNLLMARGASSVVLVGQSLGTNRVLLYSVSQ